MPDKGTLQSSAVRIFEKVIGGGLGAGNLGVVMSRTGVGKTGFLIGLAIDHLLHEKKVLYISTKESVEHINTFFDQIFHSMAEALGMQELPQKQLRMERNRYIHVYNPELFSLEKLDQSVAFLTDATGFKPEMVILDGTPRFSQSEEWEIQGVKKLAQQWQAEVWTSSNVHREGQEFNEQGVPTIVARFDQYLDVIVNLCTETDHVKVQVIKEHANSAVPKINMELDPKTMLLRWR